MLDTSVTKIVSFIVDISFTVNRTCSSRFDNLICDNRLHRDWFDIQLPGFEDTKVWQCSCTGDLCNSSHYVTVSITALLLSAALGSVISEIRHVV